MHIFFFSSSGTKCLEYFSAQGFQRDETGEIVLVVVISVVLSPAIEF